MDLQTLQLRRLYDDLSHLTEINLSLLNDVVKARVDRDRASGLTIEVKQQADEVKAENERLTNALSQLQESFEELVFCPICRAILARPWIFRECGHTFCEACLCEQFAANDYNCKAPGCEACCESTPTPGLAVALLARIVYLATVDPSDPSDFNPDVWSEMFCF